MDKDEDYICFYRDAVIAGHDAPAAETMRRFNLTRDYTVRLLNEAIARCDGQDIRNWNRHQRGPAERLIMRRRWREPAAIAAEIDRIRSLRLDALRRQWRLVFGRVPPAGLNKDLLGRMIAGRLQERAFGGLDHDSLRFLESLARHERSPRRQLKPGTVLVREYQGRRHIVTTVRDGFDWQGTTYRSLSAVARAITGTAWSGPRFFGLQRAGDGTKARRKSAVAPDAGRRQRRAAHGSNGPHAMNGSSPKT